MKNQTPCPCAPVAALTFFSSSFISFHFIYITTFLLVVFHTPLIQAETPNKGDAFNLYVENDSRSIGGPGSDKGYSNGFKFSYVWAQDKSPEWLEEIFTSNDYLKKELENSTKNFGIGISHKIYTPGDTAKTELIKNDRPYAGWLELSFSAAFNRSAHSSLLEIGLGFVGPEAIGKEVQNNFHRLIEIEESYGWNNQLAFEPTFQINYQHRFKFLQYKDQHGKKYFDLIPFAGMSLGNALTQATAGGYVRIGTSLPEDFGPSRPSLGDGNIFVDPKQLQTSVDDYLLYVFAGLRGNAVARDIVLDGNTFKDSHSVTKYPFTSESEIGVGVHFDHLTAIWRFVTRGPQFKEKRQFNSFASISLSYIF